MATATLNQPNALTYGPIYPIACTSGLQTNVLLISRSDPTADPWEQILRQLIGMEQLEDNWDREGSEAPSLALVQSTVQLANSLRHRGQVAPSRVGAGPDGTVLLEWQDGANYFEIEVCAPNEAEWMLAIPCQPAKHGEFRDWSSL